MADSTAIFGRTISILMSILSSGKMHLDLTHLMKLSAKPPELFLEVTALQSKTNLRFYKWFILKQL